MFNHRRKIIGKSVYYIVENDGYMVREIYNDRLVASSKYTHSRIDDALEELNNIRCEQYYTDNSNKVVMI